MFNILCYDDGEIFSNILCKKRCFEGISEKLVKNLFRCGKILCIRHRPAEMHMCTRIRKLQNVSD